MTRAHRAQFKLQSGATVVLDNQGATGTVVALPDEHNIIIRVDEEPDARRGRRQSNRQGRHLRVPADSLHGLPDGRFRLAPRSPREEPSSSQSSSTVVPLAEEHLHVDRRSVPTGRVTVDKTVTNQQRTIAEPTFTEHAHVRAVPVHRIIDEPAEVREEGDELIIPLMEEVLVVEKKLMLREELHISRTRSEQREARTYTLRREDAHVRRTDEPPVPQETTPGKVTT